MPGPLKNSRHERFAQEYTTGSNVFEVAAECGIELKSEGLGFYVYFLADRRDGSIFYVGKGKGKRLTRHRKDARSTNSVNQVKAQRIEACGRHLAEIVFADDLDEVSAYRLEKKLIERLPGLTNIARGSVHPLESVLASIDRGMGIIRNYDDWIAHAHPKQLDAAVQLSGSTEAFYRMFWDHYYDLRKWVVRELCAVKNRASR